MGLVITFLLGLFFIVGSLFTKFSKNTKAIENISISVALGTMTSLIIFDLFPEMLEHMNGISIIWVVLLVLSGVGILKILDFFVPEHDHEHGLHHDCSEENLIHIGIVSLIAIVLHNIIEGMAVYSISIDSFNLSNILSKHLFLTSSYKTSYLVSNVLYFLLSFIYLVTFSIIFLLLSFNIL